jgi:hypothetical protein
VRGHSVVSPAATPDSRSGLSLNPVRRVQRAPTRCVLVGIPDEVIV